MVDLGEVRQRAGKLVRCFAAEGDFDPAMLRSNTFAMEWPPRSGAEREFPEVDRAEWLDPNAARRKILPAQEPFVDRLLTITRNQVLAPSVPDPSECATARAKTTTVARWIWRQRLAPILRRQ